MLRARELQNKLEKTINEFKNAQPFSEDVRLLIDEKFRLEFNYNSNHLEGNTLTYSETELLLRFDKVEGNHDYRDYQEMQAHDVAFFMIENEAKDLERPLTENFIRTLNQTLLVKPYWKDAITQSGDPARKQIIPGDYKSTPNSVRLSNGTIFHYTAPADVPNEMNNLLTWLGENLDKETPITLAATLHYKFVRIHPFDDGNGRTARLLMNYILVKFGLPVIIIKSEEKKEYLSALNKADAGDMQYFIDYIANQLLWSLEIQLKASRGESIEEDDDVEKEFSVLRKKLSTLPDEFDKKKDNDSLIDMLRNSIFPLYDKISELSENISDLFVECTEGTYFIYKPTTHKARPFKFISDTMSDAQIIALINEDPISLDLDLNLTALKKATESTDFMHTINVHLDEYHYSVSLDKSEIIIRLPYGRNLSDKNTKTIMDNLTKEIIKEIKEATNIQ